MITYQTSSVNSTRQQGLYIASVSYNPDFQVGDRIIAVNDIEVATCGQIQQTISACHAGDEIGVTVLRDGRRSRSA